MKKLFLLMLTMVLLQGIVFATKTQIVLKSVKQKDVKEVKPRSLFVEVAGYYDSETGELALHFIQNIGEAMVSLSDESGTIVYSQIVHTGINVVRVLPLPEGSGIYVLSITSDSYTGIGEICK